MVFGLDKEGIIDIAINAARLCPKLEPQLKGTQHPLRVQRRRASRGTENEYALEICAAVSDVIEPDAEQPARSSTCRPRSRCTRRTTTATSSSGSAATSPTATATSSRCTRTTTRAPASRRPQFGLMAGADRVEGRCSATASAPATSTSINVALNLLTQGIDPELDISDIDALRRVAEYCNRLPVHPRHPYVGDLVYTSFSGSHQDAIKKGFERRSGSGDYEEWGVPYLPIDPKHVGRTYEAVIRVNSQSGKGGVAYLMKAEHGSTCRAACRSSSPRRSRRITEDTGTDIPSAEMWVAFEGTVPRPRCARPARSSHETTTGAKGSTRHRPAARGRRAPHGDGVGHRAASPRSSPRSPPTSGVERRGHRLQRARREPPAPTPRPPRTSRPRARTARCAGASASTRASSPPRSRPS